jgi:hypothetical protein
MAIAQTRPTAAGRATLVAVEMGYGHLRAAHALAEELRTEVVEFDRPPLASPDEQRAWQRARRVYEMLSRASQVPLAGAPLRRLLEMLTSIPHLHPARDLSSPSLSVRVLERFARRGLGRALLDRLHADNATLVTTFYAPAVLADYRGSPRIVCVVTDADVNRVWASRHAAHTAVRYCVPSERAARRLQAFGVPEHHIHLTGFPLPPELLGGSDLLVLRRNLAARLVRLDPAGAFLQQSRQEVSHFVGTLPAREEGRPPLLTFAIGGAGAQLRIVRQFLWALREPVQRGRLRLALVAGVRRPVAERLQHWAEEAGVASGPGSGVEILYADSFADYYRRFNALLAETDVLWTKPSELTFFAALGIPLVFAPPVGVHERLNRRWAIHRGAGFKQESPRFAWNWLREWLEEGTLAAAAWNGYLRLPKFGTSRIAEVVRQVASES